MLPLSNAFAQYQLLNSSTHEPAVVHQKLCSIIAGIMKERQSLPQHAASPSAKELSELNFSIEPSTTEDFVLIDSSVKEFTCQDMQDQLQAVQEEISAELRLIEIHMAEKPQLSLLSKTFVEINALSCIKKFIEEKKQLAQECRMRASNLLFQSVMHSEMIAVEVKSQETTQLAQLQKQQDCLKNAIEASEHALAALDLQDKQIQTGNYGNIRAESEKAYGWQLKSSHDMVKALELSLEIENETANSNEMVRDFHVVQDPFQATIEVKDEKPIVIRAAFDPSQGSVLGAYTFKSLWNQASRISNSLAGKEIFSQWHSSYSGKVCISLGQLELILIFNLHNPRFPGAIAMPEQLHLSQNLRRALDIHAITPQQVMRLLEQLSSLEVDGQKISMISRDSGAMLLLKQKCENMLLGMRTQHSIASA